MAELRIREIYRSIQGESTFAGWPCTFVRTAGCDIRCVYCDEPAALSAAGGRLMGGEEILGRVRRSPQGTLLHRDATLSDLRRLTSNRDHRVAKTIQLAP